MLNAIVNFILAGRPRILTAALLLALALGMSDPRAASEATQTARPDVGAGAVLVDLAIDISGAAALDTRGWRRHEGASGCWQWPPDAPAPAR